MSVYSIISELNARELLHNYELGDFVELAPIHHGTVNSNYYLTTVTGKYILTIFETLSTEKLFPIFKFTEFLNANGIICPKLYPTKNNNYFSEYDKKPVAIVECFQGHHIEVVSKNHIKQICHWLAKMHNISPKFGTNIDNTMGDAWRNQTIHKVYEKLKPEELKLIKEVSKLKPLKHYKELPKGIIHADLFRDNVLFNSDKLSGVIDFYFACTGYFIYDLAILINDWCPNDAEFAISCYEEHRPLLDLEHDLFADIRVIASTRFWLSRLDSLYFTEKNCGILIKNPKFYFDLLHSLGL